MITIEDVLPSLHELFIEKLPLYIEEINKEKNDGLLLLPFEKTKLCLKTARNYHALNLNCWKLNILKKTGLLKILYLRLHWK